MSVSSTRAALDDLTRRIGERATRETLALAEAIGVKAARRLLDQAARQRLARQLLAQGMPRAEAQAVLTARLGVSRPTAYRALAAALNQRQGRGETPAGHARGIEHNPRKD